MAKIHIPVSEETLKIRRLEKERQELQIVIKGLTRSNLRQQILNDEIQGEDLIDIMYAFPIYEVGKLYKEGDLFHYHQVLYEVIQEHTSQEDWIPSENPALYKVKTPEGIIAEWVQPLGSHDAYQTDDVVKHKDKKWISVIDDNVWEPGVYGWEIYTG